MGQEEAKRLTAEELLAFGPINVLDKPRKRTPATAPQQQAVAPVFTMPTVKPLTDITPAGLAAWNKQFQTPTPSPKPAVTEWAKSKRRTPRQMQDDNAARNPRSASKTKSRF